MSPSVYTEINRFLLYVEPGQDQKKKGNEWHFGMKAHIGVDADSGLVHTVMTTAANVNNVTQAHALLHGEETHAFGDAGYTGVTKREENHASTVTWHVAMKPGKRRVLPDTPLGHLLEKIEHAKHTSQGRASVSCSEESVQTPQDPLSWTGKENCSAFDAVWYGQSDAGQKTLDSNPCPRCVLSRKKRFCCSKAVLIGLPVLLRKNANERRLTQGSQAITLST
jgi:hypothetical protein